MEYVENKELEEKEIKGIFTDIVKYSPSKLCGMLGNVITVPIYTNLFSTEEYGLYTISIAMLSFLCIIFSDWVGLSGLRFFRHHQLEKDLPKYLTTLVTILTLNMTAMFVLSFIFRNNMYNFFHVPFKYFVAVLFLVIPVAIRALLSQMLRAQLKSVSYTVATILNQFVTIFLAVFFAKFMNMGAASILMSMGISISLIDILLLYQSEILKVFRFQKVEWKFIFPIIKYGIPIAATSLSAWLITQSNKFIMNGIHGFSKAALVGVGYGLTLPILMTLFAMMTVAAIPRIYNMYEAKVDVRPIISKFLGYYILISLPIITVMSIYAPGYTHIFANAKFAEASVLIPYFSFGVFFLAMTDYTTLQYHLANKTYIEFVIKLLSGIIGVILNVLLIPKMGLTGVGIATLAANFLYWLLSSTIVLKGFNLRIPKNTLIRIALSTIPAGLTVYLLATFGNELIRIVNGNIILQQISKLFSYQGFSMLAVLTVFYLVYAIIKFKFYKVSD